MDSAIRPRDVAGGLLEPGRSARFSRRQPRELTADREEDALITSYRDEGITTAVR